MDIKYSIIIPLYNKEDFIKNTILSIKNQNYKNYEIIVIDDMSKDKSFSNVTELKKELNYGELFIYRNEKNSGVVLTRNKGIELANGDYLIFLDADDELADVNFLNNINNYIKQYNAEYILTTRNYYGKFLKPNFKFIRKYLSLLNKDFYKVTNNRKVVLKGNFPFGGSASAVIARELLNNHRFDNEESAYEDWLFFIKLFLKTEVYYYRPAAVKVNYDNNSLSNSKEINKNVIPKLPKLLSYLNESEENSQLRKRFFWIWMTGVIRRNRAKSNIRKIVQLYKAYMYKNLVLNKYSIYCISMILIFLIKRETSKS
ncbi:glycosyltransferase family 2 protein [Bacillus sp. AG4(2022)]|uniref:glycosyltransferase family 2 protein n=1 Tax=Bacillus sp. AG4(2022) TaxID=2962594 RepID=UPI002880C616|nr:glycosyltransferase family 2 protein [Bacillus sp. AG4(2022)]MDT0161598.1 glycosyltransferase family 2 protein [Bacillus sp. AG4(2022)]